MKQMQVQVQEAALATVDSDGLLANLLEQKASQRSDFELLLDKPSQPELTMKEKLVKRAIEAIQSGEFLVLPGFYYMDLTHPQTVGLQLARACGCAIAALYYAGVQLEVAQQCKYAGQAKIRDALAPYVDRDELCNVEEKYESDYTGGQWRQERMIECLNGMLEGQ